MSAIEVLKNNMMRAMVAYAKGGTLDVDDKIS